MVGERDALEAAKAELEAAKADLGDAKAKLQKETDVLEAGRTELSDGRSALDAERAAIVAEHREVEDRRAELETARTELEAARQESMTAAALETDRIALLDRIAALDTKVEDLTEDRSRLEQRLADRAEEHADLESQMAAAQAEASWRAEEISRITQELEEVTAAYEDQSRRLQVAREDATTYFLSEEIQRIVGSAQETARQMLDRTRTDAGRQVAEADRWWREVQTEIGRYASWRSQVEPMLFALQERVGEVRARVEELAGQATEASSSMTNALLSMDSGMGLLSMAFEAKPIHGPLLAPPDGTPIASLTASDELGAVIDHGSEGEAGLGMPVGGKAEHEGRRGDRDGFGRGRVGVPHGAADGRAFRLGPGLRRTRHPSSGLGRSADAS